MWYLSKVFVAAMGEAENTAGRVGWEQGTPVLPAAHWGADSVLAAPLPIRFPARGLGKLPRLAEVLGSLPHTRKTWKKLLASKWSSTGHLWPFGGNEPANEEFYVCVCPSLSLCSFQNKQIIRQVRQAAAEGLCRT